MGMYTGLRARVKVKPEYCEAISMLHLGSEWDDWREVYMAYDVPNLDKWLEYGRHNFIPFGTLSCMPDNFDNKLKQPNEYGGGSEWDGEYWEFACSLKNYENEIDFFVPNVLFMISESVDYCHHLYEEYPSPYEVHNQFDSRSHIYEESEEWWMKYVTDWKPLFDGENNGV